MYIVFFFTLCSVHSYVSKYVTPVDDFDLLDTTVQFTPGTREGSFRFRANRDAVKEKNETVTLTLNITDSGGIDVVVGPMGTTSVTIIDDNG